MPRDDQILREQAEYYSARAPEYDEWFFRRGRFDRGDEDNRQWSEEVASVEAWLAERGDLGDVLELACGTGLWTRHLLARSRRIHAVDGSAEMQALCRARVDALTTKAAAPSPVVTFELADLFAWRPAQRYDSVFFGFWLSHVPEERFDAFWDTLSRALRPGGTVFLVDSLYDERSTARDHVLGDPAQTVRVRRLNNGREYRVVKVFRAPPELGVRLHGLGWRSELRASGRFFVYGTAQPAASRISQQVP